MKEKIQVGEIIWRDLTINNAKEVSGFYADVIGWEKQPVSMGDYDDFNMCSPSTGDHIAGVCHARGANSDIPPQWMMYVRVENVEKSIQTVKDLGGSVLKGPTQYSGDTYYVISDPAGAVLTIFSS